MCDILFFILTTDFACSFSVSFMCKVVVYLRDFLFLEILLYCFKLATAFFHLATRATCSEHALCVLSESVSVD